MARKAQAPLSQIAKDFRDLRGCLHNWLKNADIDEGHREGLSGAERAQCASSKRNRLLEQENEVLRRAAAYLSQAESAGKIVFPLVREMAAAGAPIRVPVAVAVLGPGSIHPGYYKWLKEPLCQRDWDDAQTINILRELHEG